MRRAFCPMQSPPGPHHGRGMTGTLSFTHTLQPGSPVPIPRASSTGLPRQGAGLTLLSVAAVEGQGNLSLSSPTLMTLMPALLTVITGKGKGRGRGHLSLIPPLHRRQEVGLAHTQNPCTHIPRAISTCCQEEVPGLLSAVRQLVRGRDSSPKLISL